MGIRLADRDTVSYFGLCTWVAEALHKEHGDGGVIALDNEGNGKRLDELRNEQRLMRQSRHP
jgi:hypothetical protein